MSSSQTFTIGYSQRDTFNGQTGSPGPTHYDDTKGQKLIKEHSPEWQFSKSGRPNVNGGGPGPGTYERNDQANGQSFSMRGKNESQSSYLKYQSQAPGPGQYDVQNHRQSPSFTMGTKQTIQEDNRVPGPGQYSQRSFIDQKSQRASSSNVGFGSKVQKNGNQSNNSFSRTTLTSPGPGQYQPVLNGTKYNNPTYGFSKGQKGITYRDLSPGPGSYDDSNLKGISNNGIHVTMGGRPQTAKPQVTPGPGEYDRNDSNNHNSSQKYSAMKSTVPRMSNLSRDFQSPGPGQYNASDSLSKDKIPTVSFSNAKRTNGSENKSQLGPGSYNSKSTKHGPSYTMGQVPRKKNKNSNPGPGNYEVNNQIVKDAVRSFKMSQAQNNTLYPSKSTSQIVGPGSYQQNNNDFGKSAPKFTMKGRPYDNNRNNSPGPGAYEPNSSYSKDKPPTFSIKNSKRDSSMSRTIDNPGPGSYNQNDKFRSNTPSYTVGQRQQQSYDTLSPGPGAYNANNQLTKDYNPSFSQSQSKRDTGLNKDQLQSPGPGNYNSNHKQIGQNATSYTMGRKSNERNDTLSPGPGAYNANDQLTKDFVPSFGQNKSQRDSGLNKEQMRSPGPGNYDVNNKQIGQNAKSFTIGRKSNERNDTLSPGPGAYNEKDSLVKAQVKSYKMSTSTRQDNINKEQKNTPGPGNYANSSKFGASAQKATIKGRPKETKKNNNPGPGNYNPNSDKVKESTRVYKMSQSKRKEIVSSAQKQLPGPGMYESPSKFGKDTPVYTIQSKRQEIRRDSTPGPGEYNAKDTLSKNKSQSYKIGTTHRQSLVDQNTISQPGPGNYGDIDQFGKDSKSFTIRGKQEQRYETLSPGPGVYNPSQNYTKDNVIGYRMSNSARQEIVSKESKNQPGPGNYDSPSRIGKGGPQYTIGNKSAERHETLSPGPGAYQPLDTLVKDKTKSAAMSQSQRQDFVSKQAKETPGPGNYNEIDQFGRDSQSFAIRGRPREVQSNNNLGPGQYDQNDNQTKDRSVSYKMSQSQRQGQVSKETQARPGPGNYDTSDNFGKDAQTFTIQGKSQQQQANRVPGPGEYEPSLSQTRDNVVSYKMSSSQRQDIVSKEARSQPGPGNYSSPERFGKEGQSFTIQGKQNEQANNNVPGPGEYDYNQSQTKDRVVSHKMSTSQRQDIVSKEEQSKIGPGNYDSPERLGKDSKSFTIAGKSQNQAQNNVPGPGEYDQNQSQTKDRVVSYKMSSSQRQDIVSKEEQSKIGPGNYDSPEKFGKDSKSFTIAGKAQDQAQNNVPGPGEYDQNHSQTKDNVISYKISSSKRQDIISKEARNQPGPGNYASPERFGKDGQSFTMQGKQIEQNNNNVPGPGEYDYNQSQTRDRVISHKMSSSQRQDIVSKEEQSKIGPGNYDSPERFGKDSKSFTIAGKAYDQAQNNVPGPGEYDQNYSQTKDNVVAYKISQSQRQDIVSKEARNQPGPGNYTSQERFGKDGQSFTMQGKSIEQNNNNVPGPGEYDYNQSQTKDRVVSHKMSSSQRQDIVSKEEQNKIGPGNYDSPERFGKDSKSFTIAGKAQNQTESNVPGPGEYDYNESQTKDRVVSHKMSSSQRQDIVSKEEQNKVGPGNYDSPERFGKDSKSFTIAGKAQDQAQNNVPGPGEYDQNYSQTKDNVVSYKINQSQRQDIVSKEARNQPGPGNYSSPERFGKDGQSFTMQGKSIEQNNNNVPGPGEYEQLYTQTKDKVVSYKMSQSQRPDIVSKEDQSRVGPGNYDSPERFGKDSQSFTIAGKSQEQAQNNVPGPGEYDYDLSQTRDRVVSHKMSQSQRQNVLSNEEQSRVGPGNYDVSDTFGKDGQNFTIRGRSRDQQVDNVPGPGEYDQSQNYTRDRVVSHKMSSGQRQDIVSKEARNQPGPGNYDSPERFGKEGQSFTMGGKAINNIDNRIPGPGEYDQNHSLTKDNVISYKISQSQREGMVSSEAINRPGPGNYENHDNFGRDAQGFIIRGRPQDNERNQNPGPGEYNPDVTQTRDRSVSYNMSKSERQEIVSSEQRNQPGPGNYDQESYIGRGQAASIRGRPSPDRESGNPGPGEYNSKYDIVKDKIQAATLGKSSRDFLTVQEGQVGPGSYDLSNQNNGRSFTIQDRAETNYNNNYPGPGTYNADQSLTKDRITNADFGRQSIRDDKLGSPDKTQNPGPGSYDQRSYNVHGNDSVVYSFNKSEPVNHDDGYPGPGHYKLPTKFADIPPYSVPKQSEEFKYV